MATPSQECKEARCCLVQARSLLRCGGHPPCTRGSRCGARRRPAPMLLLGFLRLLRAAGAGVRNELANIGLRRRAAKSAGPEKYRVAV